MATVLNNLIETQAVLQLQVDSVRNQLASLSQGPGDIETSLLESTTPLWWKFSRMARKLSRLWSEFFSLPEAIREPVFGINHDRCGPNL